MDYGKIKENIFTFENPEYKGRWFFLVFSIFFLSLFFLFFPAFFLKGKVLVFSYLFLPFLSFSLFFYIFLDIFFIFSCTTW